MNFSLVLNGPHLTAPLDPPYAARSVVTTVTVGPLPYALTSVIAAVQKREPGGIWVDCGGLSASGVGQTFSATTHHDCTAGWRFRARVDVAFGPAPVIFNTVVG